MRGLVTLVIGASSFALASQALATPVILTFDEANSCVFANNLNGPAGPCSFGGQNISPTFGSTPQLSVTYRNFDGSGNVSDNNLNWSSDGSAYATSSNGPPEDLEFIFTPLAGFEVSLSSIESWVNSGVTPVLGTFSLFAGNQLVSSTAFAASAEALALPHTVTSFGGGYFSDPLRLRVTPASSRVIQFDNIALDVRQTVVSAVPEPATWAMMIAGFGAIGGAMRRRRSGLALQTA